MTRPERLLRRFRLRGATAGILLICLLAGTATSNQEHQSERRAGTLPDLSGLAWIDGDRFLAVHDAKNPEENQFPRVSIVRLPRSLDGPAWEPLEVDWPPPLGLSSDLESIARIPGTQSYLLVESGEGKHNGRRYLRVFQVELHDRALKIVSFTELPAQVKNIEGAAVARLGERLVFIFAERAGDHRGTIINWADLRLQPLRIGDARQVRFAPAGFVGPGLRPVSALEIDREGRVYAASAFDPDDDNGPYRSAIWRIGQVRLSRDGAEVVLDARPQKFGVLDGFKVESLALRESAGRVELFAGTDDENYGATLRLIPPRRVR